MAVRENDSGISGTLHNFKRQLEDLIGEVDRVLAKVDEDQISKGLKEKPIRIV